MPRDFCIAKRIGRFDCVIRWITGLAADIVNACEQCSVAHYGLCSAVMLALVSVLG